MSALASTVRPEAERRERAPVSAPRLWAPLLGAPLLALVLHQTEYLLVPWACERGWRWPLHAVALLALLGTMGLGLLARGSADRAPEADALANSSAARSARRTRFMGQVGLLAAGLASLTVLAYWITVLVLDPCHRA